LTKSCLPPLRCISVLVWVARVDSCQGVRATKLTTFSLDFVPLLSEKVPVRALGWSQVAAWNEERAVRQRRRSLHPLRCLPPCVGLKVIEAKPLPRLVIAVRGADDVTRPYK
jgi:hypothetical protein